MNYYVRHYVIVNTQHAFDDCASFKNNKQTFTYCFCASIKESEIKHLNFVFL